MVEHRGADSIAQGTEPMPPKPTPKGFEGNTPASQINADHLQKHNEEVRLLREKRDNARPSLAKPMRPLNNPEAEQARLAALAKVAQK